MATGEAGAPPEEGAERDDGAFEKVESAGGNEEGEEATPTTPPPAVAGTTSSEAEEDEVTAEKEESEKEKEHERTMKQGRHSVKSTPAWEAIMAVHKELATTSSPRGNKKKRKRGSSTGNSNSQQRLQQQQQKQGQTGPANKQKKKQPAKKQFRSAYYHFFHEQKERMDRGELPYYGDNRAAANAGGGTPQTLSQRMGELWRNLSVEERLPYFQMESDEKRRNGDDASPASPVSAPARAVAATKRNARSTAPAVAPPASPTRSQVGQNDDYRQWGHYSNGYQQHHPMPASPVAHWASGPYQYPYHHHPQHQHQHYPQQQQQQQARSDDDNKRGRDDSATTTTAPPQAKRGKSSAGAANPAKRQQLQARSCLEGLGDPPPPAAASSKAGPSAKRKQSSKKKAGSSKSSSNKNGASAKTVDKKNPRGGGRAPATKKEIKKIHPKSTPVDEGRVVSKEDAAPPRTPTYVACGRCMGCRSRKNCGRCLPCKLLDDLPPASLFSSSLYQPTCIKRICTEPVLARAAEAAAGGGEGGRGKRTCPTTARTDEDGSEVESLSDNGSFVERGVSDMSDNEEKTAAEAEANRPMEGRVLLPAYEQCGDS